MLHIRTQPSLNRDFALLSLFIIFLMIMMSAWVAFETFDSQKKDITQRMHQAALRMDNALAHEISHARYVMEAIGKQIIGNGGNNYASISRVFQSFNSTNGEDRIIFSWVNRDQQLVVNSHFGVLDNPINVSDRDYVKRALAEPWRITLGRPIKGRLSKQWVLPMSIGISADSGTFLGVLYMGLIIDRLSEEAKKAIGDDAISFAITNRAFSTLKDSSAANGGFKRYFDLNQLMKKDFISAQQGLYSSALPWNTRSIFAYYQTSDKQPFVYFLMYDRDKSNALLRQVLLARIFQLIAVGAFLLFVLYTVRKRIIQPVLVLTRHTHAATIGSEFNASTHDGPQEIQSLTREIYKFWLFIQERKRIEAELRLKLSELVRIREAATLTNRVKSDFFILIAESLRPALQMIREQSETIKDQHFGPISNQKYLKNADDIFAQTNAVNDILQEMIKIATRESGIISLQEEELNTKHLIQKSITRAQQDQPNLMLVQLDSGSPFTNMYADKLRILQCFGHVFSIIAQQITSSDTVRISSNIRSGDLNIFFSFAHDARNNAPLQSLSISISAALARLLIALHGGDFEIKTTPERITTITLKIPASRLL